MGVFRILFWISVAAMFVVVRLSPDNVDASQLFAAEGLLAFMLASVAMWVECYRYLEESEHGPFSLLLKVFITVGVTAMFVMFVDVWGRFVMHPQSA